MDKTSSGNNNIDENNRNVGNIKDNRDTGNNNIDKNNEKTNIANTQDAGGAGWAVANLIYVFFEKKK